MNPDVTGEVELTAEKFAARHIAPVAADVDHGDPVFPAEIFARGIEAGFDKFALPETAGGYGFAWPDLCRLIGALARVCPAHAMIFGVHAAAINAIYETCPERFSDLTEKYFTSGKAIGAAFPDPKSDGGFETDLVAQSIDSEGLELNGPASLIANVAPGGSLLLFASESNGRPHVLLADGSAPGFGVGPLEPTLGLRAMPMAVCSCAHAKVGATRVIASDDAARRFYSAFLRSVCLVASSAAWGAARAACQKAYDYAAERYQGGKLIIDHSHLRNILGAMSARVSTFGDVVLGAVARPKDTIAALGTKVTVTGGVMRACTDAVQVLGGYGYMRDFGLEKLMRDAAVLSLLPISNARAELLIAAIEKSNL